MCQDVYLFEYVKSHKTTPYEITCCQRTYEISEKLAILTSHILFVKALINTLMLFMYCRMIEKKTCFLFMRVDLFILQLWLHFQCNKQIPRGGPAHAKMVTLQILILVLN